MAVTTIVPPGRFVRVKLAAVETPATVARTVSPPEIVFAVNVLDVAMPFASVSARVLAALPPFGFEGSVKVPLAPVLGAVKTTIALLTGFLPLSKTVA